MQLHIFIKYKERFTCWRACHAYDRCIENVFAKNCVHWRIVTRIFTAICLRLVAVRAMNSFKKKEKNRTNVEDVKRWVSLVTSSLLKNLYSYRVRCLFLIKIIMGLIAKFIFSPIVRSSRQLNYSQIMPCLLLCSNRHIKRHNIFMLLTFMERS